MAGAIEIDASGWKDKSAARVRFSIAFHGETNEIISVDNMRSMSMAEAAPYLTEAMVELFHAAGPFVLTQRLSGMVETMKKSTPTDTWELPKPVLAYKENPFKVEMHPGPTKEYDYPLVVFHGYTLSPIQFAEMVQKIFKGGGHEAWATAVPTVVREGVETMSKGVVAATNRFIEEGRIQVTKPQQEEPEKPNLLQQIFGSRQK